MKNEADLRKKNHTVGMETLYREKHLLRNGVEPSVCEHSSRNTKQACNEPVEIDNR